MKLILSEFVKAISRKVIEVPNNKEKNYFHTDKTPTSLDYNIIQYSTGNVTTGRKV